VELVNPTLHLEDEEVEKVQRVIRIALLCFHIASLKRATMARIILYFTSRMNNKMFGWIKY
jgi:hypothetical protein